MKTINPSSVPMILFLGKSKLIKGERFYPVYGHPADEPNAFAPVVGKFESLEEAQKLIDQENARATAWLKQVA